MTIDSGAVQRPKENAPKAAARALRDAILALPPGVSLGSESDLIARWKLGRSTLRQAARILEEEQLLQVRRGIGGGYFTRRPDATGVARAASLFFRLEHTTFVQSLHTAHLINMEIARLASLSQDDALRDRLGATRDEWQSWDGGDPGAARLIEADVALSDLLAAMAGNPPLNLFRLTLFQFGLDQRQRTLFGNFPGRRSVHVGRRIQQIQAVVQGDGEVAALLAGRINDLITEWVKQDLEVPAGPASD